jgi:dipeptidyl aminopeptidase/acylaminoacyl peptidase
MIRSFVFALAFVFLMPLSEASLKAQSGPALSLEKIMAGDQWIGHQPGNPWWAYDGSQIYFPWNPEDNPSDSLYGYDLKTGNLVKVGPRQRRELPPRQVAYDSDRRRIAFVNDGDLFIRNIRRGETIRLTNTLERISSPAFTKDGKKISYSAGDNMFLLELASGKTRQITDFRHGHPPADGAVTPQEQWLEDQQTDLFRALRERRELDVLRQEQREQDQPERPLPVYTGSSTAGNLQLSPCERFVVYALYTRPDARETRIPDFVTASGFTEISSAYPKVGAPQLTISAGIYDLERKMSYDINTANIPGLRDVPGYMREYGFEAGELATDRAVNITGVFWSASGESAVVNIRAKDNKDRWIMLLDPETGELSPLNRQRDEAWIAGPGINIRGDGSGMGWMPDSRRIWFQSEQSGWSHLYTLDVATGVKTALTSGQFEVYDPEISPDKKHWYFSSNEVHPGERHFYRMPLEGGTRTQITVKEGRHDVSISPDGKKLAIRYSHYNKPWELYVMENKPGAETAQITFSLSEEFREYDWRIPELLTFTASDGEQVWARLYRPDNPEPRGPAVIFVHGAGYLQNAHKWWSSYLREYMFHNLLADKGYTVLDIDFRGSAGYGRDWRTGIYRHMGGIGPFR